MWMQEAREKKLAAKRTELEAAEAEVAALVEEHRGESERLAEAVRQVDYMTPVGEDYRLAKEGKRHVWTEVNALEGRISKARQKAATLAREIRQLQAEGTSAAS